METPTTPRYCNNKLLSFRTINLLQSKPHIFQKNHNYKIATLGIFNSRIVNLRSVLRVPRRQTTTRAFYSLYTYAIDICTSSKSAMTVFFLKVSKVFFYFYFSNLPDIFLVELQLDIPVTDAARQCGG